MPAEHTHHLGTRAVVIGASIGGLLAARVLADHYDEVVLVDRDTFGPYGKFRKGVMQARHAHALLAGGMLAIEELLPGLERELIARGSVSSDMQAACSWINEGRPLSSEPSGRQGILTSRLLLEDQVRARVLALPNVVAHERVDVRGLTQPICGQVAGLRIAWRDRDDAEELVTADLVVDASGRSSRAPAWLAAIGYRGPRTDEIVVGLSYTTREFHRRDPDDEGHNVVVGATVEHPRAGVILVQPDGRWIVTLGGYLGDAAPTDLDGFRDFAASMPAPHLADALAGLTPIGDARTFKYHASRWRRYDRLRGFPEGFLVFGDAISSFNPIYGQGITVAAREALALQRCLRTQGTDRLAKRFFAAAAREIAVPWELAASSDLRLPAVQGRRSLKVRAVNRYMPKYFRAAEHDPQLSTAFLEVVNLLARPESLLSPRNLLRVWRGGRRRAASMDAVEATKPAEVAA